MKKVVSLIIAIIMIVTCVPIQVFALEAQADVPTLTIDSPYAAAGQTVDVNVMIKDNVGIFGAILTFEFPSELTLQSVTQGQAFENLDVSLPDSLTSPYTIFCDGIDTPATADGTIITFSFLVSENAEANAKLPVMVSYLEGDVVDSEFKDLELNIENGNVTVIDYIPGDVNGDGRVNTVDVTWIRRYRMGGYDLGAFNEAAADVNDDGRINTIDVTLIRRYRMGGFDVTLKPSTPKCQHELKATPEVAATCTKDGNKAYWQCIKCNKYFSDEAGKTEIKYDDAIIPAAHSLTHFELKAATTTENGWIEHWKCSGCGKYYANAAGTVEKTEAEVIIPKLERKESTVLYNVYGSDPYLQSVGVENPNPTKFYSEEGLILNDLQAPAGYVFKGWTTAAGAPVTEIAASSSSRQITINANWSKVEYTVTFDSPDVNVPSEKYTVDTGITLTAPKSYGYSFVGWSNNDGFLVNNIEPGTTGNIMLHANWTSNRNKATSYSDYGKPIIIEDAKNGQFLFVYDIGRIDNVPLYPYIDEATNTPVGANGTALNIDMEYTVKEEFGESQANEIIKTVADATTRSSGWTLSEDWETLYSEGTEDTNKQVKTEERVDSQGNIVGGNYFVSNSQGGSSFVSNECGGTSANSSKVTTDKSFGINTSYDKSTEKYCDAKLSVENKTELSAGFEAPVGIGKLSAGVKNTTTIGAETTSGRKDNEAFHVDTSASNYIGTVDYAESTSHFNTKVEQSSNWNSTSGYEKSYQTSIDTSVRNAVADEISKTTTYNISEALGGAKSETSSVSGTTSSENGYSNSLRVEEYHSKTTTKHVKYTNSDIGYYRIVMAGTVHVYGVVGYDVATSSYYTYTYNVLEDDTFEYVDFSKERATFDDCENGVVTFEIPYEVNEYILGVTSETEGLEIGLDGTVNKFTTPDDFGKVVVVPQYHADTQPGNGNVAIKTTAISSDAFRGNTEIETVVLPIYITEIPDNAFEGCTNLKNVIAYGVTKIGDNAFKGCENLEKFYIDNYITELGVNAFEDVEEIAVMAYDSKVADAAIASGADKVTVDISKITDNYNNKTVVVTSDTEYFAIIGNGGEYSNLQIDSSAKETLISKIKFVNNSDTPLKIYSETATLSMVSVVDAPVYAMLLGNDHTDLKLYGEISLDSLGDNTVISKNVTLSKANNNITSKLVISGDYLVCSEVVNSKDFLNVEPKQITLDEYNMYISPCVVSFDANGGEEVDVKKTVYKGQAYGELPKPEKEYYEFLGWFTSAEGGSLVTAESTVDEAGTQTLYAQWKALTAKLLFDANEGSVDTESKIVYIGAEVGELPTPTRDYYTFAGWYTDPMDGEKIAADSVIEEAQEINLYAHWEHNPVSTWVKVSDLPSDAQVVNTKWSYTLREYTTNSASSLSGWTKYDTQRTSWGAWSGWSTTNPSNGVRNVESRSVYDHTEYHYYRWTNGSSTYTYQYNSSYWLEEKWFTYILPASSYGSALGYVGSDIGKYLWTRADYSGNRSVDKTFTRSVNRTEWRYQDPVYTYYYYRDLSLETTTANPVGQSNVSDVVEWVQYRAK